MVIHACTYDEIQHLVTEYLEGLSSPFEILTET